MKSPQVGIKENFWGNRNPQYLCVAYTDVYIYQNSLKFKLQVGFKFKFYYMWIKSLIHFFFLKQNHHEI